MLVWPICPDGDDPVYLPGADVNWQRAQRMSVEAGCPFTAGRIVLVGPPPKGTIID